jgi:tetratricopeptide (TPR) repeat protein
MKDIMIMNVKKIAFGAAVVFFTNFAFAQTVQDGINSIDSDKFAQAKTNFTNMIAKEPSAENYFYLGNTFLKQVEPDFAAATENFNKGIAADSKSYLNKIGLAAVKLGKGDKNAIAEIQKVVTDSREKDAEVLFRAAEALTLFEKNNSPDLAIQFLNKAIERAQRKEVPAHYYYTLGDAYRLKRMPGDAMTAYEKALPLAKNKASVYTRIGSLWMAAQQWQQAKTNIEKAIATDPSYAPAYKVMAAYDIIYNKN